MARLEALENKRRELLKAQTLVSDQYNNLLTSKGGGNDSSQDGALENSRKCLKNLQMAIVQSTQPGYIAYHKPSKLVKEFEQKNEFSHLISRIQTYEKEIHAVSKDIDNIKNQQKHETLNKPLPHVAGISDWFEKYGNPSPNLTSVPGFATTFSNNTKVYGGTKYHPAFKSVAVTQKRGRCTK